MSNQLDPAQARQLQHYLVQAARLVEGSQTIEMDLSDGTFQAIALLARRADITFNRMVNQLLRAYLDKLAPHQDSP